MADPLSPPTEDPFAQIDPSMGAIPKPVPPPAQSVNSNEPAPSNDNAPSNPFADLGSEAAPGQSSMVGTFARGAEKGVVPASVGLAGAGIGGASVVGLGALAGTSVGPWGTVGGAIVGGLVGGYGGSYLQNWALKQLPDSWKDALGFSERQSRLDEAQHSNASFMGGLFPYAVTMNPELGFGKGAAKLATNLTGLQRVLSTPAASKLFGGGLVGGMEAGQEKLSNEDLDWRKVAIATAFGTVFNKPNGIGEVITEIGARPTRTVFGTPHPTVAQASDLKVMGPGITDSVFHGGQEQAPSAAMAAQENARVEQAAIGEPPEPDVYAIAKQMEPETFARYDDLLKQRDTFAAAQGEGSNAGFSSKHLEATEAAIRDISPEVAAAIRRAQDTIGTGSTVVAEPYPTFAHMLADNESGTGRPARQARTQERYEITDPIGAATDGEKATVTVMRAKDGTIQALYTDNGVVEVAPAYRSLSPEAAIAATLGDHPDGATPDATKVQKVETQGSGEQPIPPSGEAQPVVAGQGENQPLVPSAPARTIAEQRSSIADDVAQKLIAAGRPADEAQASGQIIAARYVTRAGRFEGKLGTPEELYAREGAAIAGPNGRPQAPSAVAQEPQPTAPGGAPAEVPTPQAAKKILRGRAAADPQTWSLYEMLAKEGGLKPTDDLKAILGGKNPFVPGFGPLLRPTGLTMDEALTRAKESGHIIDPNDIQHTAVGNVSNAGENTVSVNQLHDMIDAESRGQKQYRTDHVPAEAKVNPEEERGSILDALHHELRESSGGNIKVDPAVEDRVIEIIQKEGEHDVLAAYERAVMEDSDRYEGFHNDRDEQIPGWDAPDIGPASSMGEPPFGERGEAGLSGQETRAGNGEKPRDDREGNRPPSALDAWNDLVSQRLPRRETLRIAKGFNDFRTKQGLSPLRAGSSQEWKPGNTVDVGFVKDLLITKDNGDGSFTLLSKPDQNGMSRIYEIKPHEGLSGRTNKVDFLDHAKDVLAQQEMAQSVDEYFQRVYHGSDYEPGAEGKPQELIPGVAPVTDAERAQLAANKPLAPKVVQKPAGGLFGDSMNQKELFQREQTPEFKNWFGNSKVTDESGAPAVVYHGAPNFEHAGGKLGDFSEFDRLATSHIIKGRTPGMDSVGSWFSDHPGDTGAGMYAGNTGSIYPVHLKIENPWEPKNFQEFLEKLNSTAGRDMVAARKKGEPAGRVSPDPFRSWLKENGYDGVKFQKGEVDSPDQTVWLALEPQQIKSAIANTGAFNPEDANILHQTARGKIRLTPGQRPVISLLKDANASTFMHESGHQFLEEMLRDGAHPDAPEGLKNDVQSVRDWLGTPDEIQTKHHEKFARGFEQYLREGVAPSPELAGVFAKFRNWMLQIYQSIKGLGTEISPDIRNVFDRMLEQEPQRTVIAPERAPMGPQLHDIHEAEAQYTEPHEAEAVASRIIAEADRHVSEPPPGIANEIATSVQRIEAEQAARTGAEPAGEAGAGGIGPSEVEPGSGGPKPDTGRSGVGNGGGEELRGGGQPDAESATANERPDPRQHLENQPLAPGPSTLFERGTFNLGKDGNVRVENITNVPQLMQAIDESSQRISTGNTAGLSMGEMLDLADENSIDPTKVTESKLASLFGGVKNLSSKVWALRTAIKQSAHMVFDAATKASLSQSDEDTVAFAMAMTRHDMMQSVLSSVTTELGRGLGMGFRSMEGWDQAKDLNQLMQEKTGRTLYQMKQIAKMAASMDSPMKVTKYLRDTQAHSYGRMALELFVNNLISGFATHVTYVVGSGVQLAEKMLLINPVAAGIGSIRASLGREGDRVHFGEFGAGLQGLKEGFAPALRGIGSALKEGVSPDLPGETDQKEMQFQAGSDLAHHGKIDMTTTLRDVAGDLYGTMRGIRDAIVSYAALVKAGGVAGSPLISARYSHLGAIPDIEIKGVNALPLGTLARAPSRGVAAIHTLFRTLNYSVDHNQQAFRMASNEGLTGNDLYARIADLRQNPTPEMMESSHRAANEGALMGQSGAFMNKVSGLLNWKTEIPGLGETQPLKFVDPFVNVAGQLTKMSIGEQTPLGFLSSEVRADIAGKNGNIAQDVAMAKMIVGSSLALAFGGLAAEGYVNGSGPTDRNQAAAWRQLGNQPHSVRIGEIWYPVNKLGPVGFIGSVAADLWDVANAAESGEYTQAAGMFMHAISQNFLDEGFMKGPADLIRAIEESDRYGEGYVRNFLPDFLPYSVGMGQWARGQDPYQRQVRTITESIRNKIPGHLNSYFGQNLYTRRDVFGESIPNLDALGGKGITAIYESRMNHDPVNITMYKLGIYPAPVKRTITNIPLTDQQYDDYARIAGRTLKMRLDKMVIAPQFQNLAPTVQHDWIKEQVDQSRKMAAETIKHMYPSIPAQATQNQKDRKFGPLKVKGQYQ